METLCSAQDTTVHMDCPAAQSFHTEYNYLSWDKISFVLYHWDAMQVGETKKSILFWKRNSSYACTYYTI